MSDEVGPSPAALIERKQGIFSPESKAGMNMDEGFGRVKERVESRVYPPATARP